MSFLQSWFISDPKLHPLCADFPQQQQGREWDLGDMNDEVKPQYVYDDGCLPVCY